MDRVFLLADIGGTHCRLALFNGRGLESVTITPTQGPGIEDVIDAYCREHVQEHIVAGAVLAAAGPKQGNRIRLTNSAWVIDTDHLSRSLAGVPVTLLNDFEAMAYAIGALGIKDFEPLSADDRLGCDRSPRIILGPGTGLGSAVWIPQGEGLPIILPGEGQHAPALLDPENIREQEIYARIRQMEPERPFVSVEDLASGPGLARIYKTLWVMEGKADTAAKTTPEIILQAYHAGNNPIAHESVMMLTTQLGRFAGRMALSVMARGGVYLAGGIVDALGDQLAQTSFMSAFEREAAFAKMGHTIPVWRVTHPVPGLLGCQVLAQSIQERTVPTTII